MPRIYGLKSCATKNEVNGAGDVVIGVRIGQVFDLAKEFIDMPLGDLDTLLDSSIHEVRVGALSILDFLARHAASMPRVSLSCAMEHLDETQRKHYRRLKSP